MKNFTPERLADLSLKMESFMELEMGERLPYISLIYSHELGLGFFTNRQSNKEVETILELALDAVRNSDKKWISLEGKVISGPS